MSKFYQHPWSSEALYNKALLHADKMESFTPEDWEYGLNSTLALEFLARAALASISPVLLADESSWRNSAFALELEPFDKHIPRSASTAAVLSRLKSLVPGFAEQAGFCLRHASWRNEAVHSGGQPFEGVGTDQWLSQFYLACESLLNILGKGLAEFFADPDGAKELIEASADKAARQVEQDIKAFKKVWETKDPEEKSARQVEAAALASRHAGHRVDCPACGSQALLHGTAHGPAKTRTDGDAEVVVERQPMRPSSFECAACGLRIAGLPKLKACKLGDIFVATFTHELAEYYGLYTEWQLEEARQEFPYEPDYND